MQTYDSSLYNSQAGSADYAIKVGVVRKPIYDSGADILYYLVDVSSNNIHTPVACQTLTRFGGAFNYEEFTRYSFELGNNPAAIGDLRFRPGDVVTVALLEGRATSVEPTGIILGSLKHRARASQIKPDDGVAYISEFNGIETRITRWGEYKQTFKGLPTNADALSKAPNGQVIPAPTYNDEVGTSFYKWAVDGSWHLSDNSRNGIQDIIVDKPNGKIIINSGKTSLTINKKEQTYSIINKKTTFNSEDEFNLNTKTTTIKSSKLFDLESTDIKTKGQWRQEGNTFIKGDIAHNGNYQQTGNHVVQGSSTISGGLTADGQCSLGGGSKTLVYDIQTIIGTGNLGYPVISYAVLLKTVKVTAD